MNTDKDKLHKSNESNLDEGYPLYPASEDIYNHAEKEEIPENGDIKMPGKLDKGIYGGDLIVPGSELDDADEITGNEDEENDYYSIGGDNHDDLEEDKGD